MKKVFYDIYEKNKRIKKSASPKVASKLTGVDVDLLFNGGDHKIDGYLFKEVEEDANKITPELLDEWDKVCSGIRKRLK